MQRLRSIRFLALIGMVMLALAACRAPAQTGAGNPGTPGSEQAGTATAAPTARSTPTTSAPTPGAVTLVLSKSSYRPGEAIEVTIKNGLKNTIFAADHRSACTLVQLERLDNGTWRSEGDCPLETPTRLVSLAPGSSLLQTLAPGTGPHASGPWPAGTYRIAFAYGAGSAGTASAQTLVYSANFVIG